MKSKIENCLYMQVAHCNKCGGQSGYNIIDGEKVCFDCGEPYEADFSVSKVETTITTTNSQDQGENEPEKVYVDPIVPDFIAEKLAEERYNTREILLNGTKPLEVEDTPEEKEDKKLYIAVEDILSDYHIGVFTDAFYITKLVELFKNLLSERERELLEDIVNKNTYEQGVGYGDIASDVIKRLSKLTTK